MRPGIVRRGTLIGLVFSVALLDVGRASAMTLEERLDALEHEVKELKAELRAERAANRARNAAKPGPAAAAASVGTTPPPALAGTRPVEPATAEAIPPAAGPTRASGAARPTETVTAPAAPTTAAARAEAPTPAPSTGTVAATTEPAPGSLEAILPAGAQQVLDRLKLGAYASTRFEASSLKNLKNTFTFRRFVLTGDASIAPRLRSYFELEFEHFRKLEVEKPLTIEAGGLRAEQAIESTDDSEISLEQAWLEFEANRALRFRTGAILVPVGRFNLNHDDNRWDLPRRPLVDRGVPVLPSTAAWDELGIGVNGDFDLGRSGELSYQAALVNGVTLDSEIETVGQARIGDTTLTETEVKLSPSTGTFNLDSKDAKAIAGRVVWSPLIGREIAGSFYWGRYTPDFLPDEDIYSLSFDGLTDLGPFQIEGEYVFTHFGGIRNVAEGFAARALNSESAIENDTTEHEIDFELAGLASDKQGYWLEVRYPFWPEFLNHTVLGHPFQNPRMDVVARAEQVWFRNLVKSAEFSNGELTDFTTESRILNRFTLGLAYRPTPLVVFSLAYEYTRTNDGKSLSSVTNFLPAGPDENENHSFLAGAAFGF